MINVSVEVIGWLGSLIIIIAYGLNSFGKIAAHSMAYQALNIFASVCLVINTIYHCAFPSALANGVWLLIGFVAIGKMWKK